MRGWQPFSRVPRLVLQGPLEMELEALPQLEGAQRAEVQEQMNQFYCDTVMTIDGWHRG